MKNEASRIPYEQVDGSGDDPSTNYICNDALILGGQRQGRSAATPRRLWAASLFSLCTILLFADQNLMSPNLTAIGNEFGFDNEERDRKLGGEIALAFFVLGAPASFVVGCLADSYNRMRLFAATVWIGEGACLLTFWSRTYAQLYVCRAVTGFSVGGALPLIYSVLGDLFAADERHSVSALVGIGTGVGISLGQGIAGFLGPTFGWRLPFLVISIPALLCATAVWLTVEDPERGTMEEAVRNSQIYDDTNSSNEDIEMLPIQRDNGPLENSLPHRTPRPEPDEVEIVPDLPAFDIRSHWASFRTLLATPTVRLALLQGAPGCVPWGIVNMYLNDFLSENRGMTVEFATFTVLMFGLGNFAGMVLGGGGATYLYRIDKRYPPLLAGSAAILGCVPFWIMLNCLTASTHTAIIVVVSWLAGLGSGVTGPIIKAQLQNVTLPQERGQAFALFNTTDDFGRGLGPVFVAALITNLGGRTVAFNIGVFGWIVCGLLNLGIFFTIVEDEHATQARVVASLSPKKHEIRATGDSIGVPPSEPSRQGPDPLQRRSFDNINQIQ